MQFVVLYQRVESMAGAVTVHLPDEGKPMVNPHNVTITFGKHTCEIRQGAGQKLPEPGASVAGRYAGIVRAVQELCKAKTAAKK